MTESPYLDGLDDAYFHWLYSMIAAVSNPNPARNHELLAEQLHLKPFRYFVPNDDNRAADGLRLRDDFCDDFGSWGDSRRPFEPCSMLEMLLGLSRHLAYETEGTDVERDVGGWFWHILENVGLAMFTDEAYTTQFGDPWEIVDQTLETLIERKYNADGTGGGLFPLKHPRSDQRKTEIWYQKSAYLLENSDIGS